MLSARKRPWICSSGSWSSWSRRAGLRTSQRSGALLPRAARTSTRCRRTSWSSSRRSGMRSTRMGGRPGPGSRRMSTPPATTRTLGSRRSTRKSSASGRSSRRRPATGMRGCLQRASAKPPASRSWRRSPSWRRTLPRTSSDARSGSGPSSRARSSYAAAVSWSSMPTGNRRRWPSAAGSSTKPTGCGKRRSVRPRRSGKPSRSERRGNGKSRGLPPSRRSSAYPGGWICTTPTWRTSIRSGT